MLKIAITSNQKKILVMGSIVGLTFIVVTMFVYLPLRRHFAQLKAKLYAIESEINQIKKAGGEGKSLEEAIAFLKERYDIMSNKFPEKEEIVLRELSNLAARLEIDVSSVRPQRKKTVQELNGLPIRIAGCYVQEMPIAMTLKTRYKTLGEYLKILNADFSIFVRVDNISMAKADKATGLLNVELKIDTYLIYPEAK